MEGKQEMKMDSGFLDEPVESVPKLRFASIPLSSKLLVPLPPILVDGSGTMDFFDEYGPRKKVGPEGDDFDSCFFALDHPRMSAGEHPKTIILPEGFYCQEFLALDPFDIQAFLAFQREFGLVHGARENGLSGTRPIHGSIRPLPDSRVFTGYGEVLYANQLAGILSSAALFDSVPDDDLLEERESLKLAAVSFREAC